MTLALPLSGPLGGVSTGPKVVNLEPKPEEQDASPIVPARMSIRDAETYVVGGQLLVGVGYAAVKASGEVSYEEEIPSAILSSTLGGFVDLEKVLITPVVDGIELTKTVTGPQRSVYFADTPLVPGNLNVLATAEIRPDSLSVGADGVVFGVEHGFRNTGAYMYLFNATGTGFPSIRIAGPADSAGVRVPDTTFLFDWSSMFRRYFVVWNEVSGTVTFYVEESGTTLLLYSDNISSFQQFDPVITANTTQPRGSAENATVFWGIEGPSGDRATFRNVALAADAGFPVFGNSLPSQYETFRISDELVRWGPDDPRRFIVSSWFGPDEEVFSNNDSAGTALAQLDGTFRLTKNTLGKTLAVYREEPAIVTTTTIGVMFEVNFRALAATVVEGRGTGMGFLLYDGQTAWQFNLFAGSIKVIGLQTTGASPTNSSQHVITLEIDWSSLVRVRFTIDAVRGLIEVYNQDVDTVNPLMSTTFNRALYQTAAESGFFAQDPFIAFGHLNDVDTLGYLDIEDLQYGSYYQAYEARDGDLPDAATPVWTRTDGGATLGSQALNSDQLVLTNAPGELQRFDRAAAWDTDRGCVLETRLQITSSKPLARTGSFLVLDDGVQAFILSFIDTASGRFVALAESSGLADFTESSERFQFDWSLPHIYRMEYRRQDGLYVFVDNETDPRLVVLDTQQFSYPTSQFLTPTVAFGQFKDEGSTSRWDYVRTMFSRGYEISFKKNLSNTELSTQLENSQAIIVVDTQDDD